MSGKDVVRILGTRSVEGTPQGALGRFRARVREITRRAKGVSIRGRRVTAAPMPINARSQTQTCFAEWSMWWWLLFQ